MTTILVIDDEECIRSLIRDLLQGPGCRVLEAGNHGAGMVVAREQQPNLILLDYLLPEASGLDVLNALAADPCTAGIPVIVMSGMAPDASLLGVLASSAVRFLMKPFSSAQLHATIQEALSPSAADMAERATAHERTAAAHVC